MHLLRYIKCCSVAPSLSPAKPASEKPQQNHASLRAMISMCARSSFHSKHRYGTLFNRCLRLGKERWIEYNHKRTVRRDGIIKRQDGRRHTPCECDFEAIIFYADAAGWSNKTFFFFSKERQEGQHRSREHQRQSPARRPQRLGTGGRLRWRYGWSPRCAFCLCGCTGSVGVGRRGRVDGKVSHQDVQGAQLLPQARSAVVLALRPTGPTGRSVVASGTLLGSAYGWAPKVARDDVGGERSNLHGLTHPLRCQALVGINVVLARPCWLTGHLGHDSGVDGSVICAIGSGKEDGHWWKQLTRAILPSRVCVCLGAVSLSRCKAKRDERTKLVITALPYMKAPAVYVHCSRLSVLQLTLISAPSKTL